MQILLPLAPLPERDEGTRELQLENLTTTLSYNNALDLLVLSVGLPNSMKAMTT